MNKEQNNIARVLGQKVEYPTTYDKTILVREARATNRQHINIKDDDLPFVGFDTWNGYEFTCLMNNGMPVSGSIKLYYPCDSEYIVESKSLKLYLNSFNFYRCSNTKYDAILNAEAIISKDLSELLETNVSVCIRIDDRSPTAFNIYTGNNISHDDSIDEIKLSTINNTLSTYIWKNLDEYSEQCSEFPNKEYNEDATLLKITENTIGRTKPQGFYCNSLFSRCKVTKQPDHGSIVIYHNSNKTIDEKSLLQYITSYRNECHFHEEICETVYSRLYELLEHPTDLFVGCAYVRRGGISILPVRASNKTLLKALAGKLCDLSVPCQQARTYKD